MKMRRMKKVKRKDALVAALWRYSVIVDSEMRYLESSSSPTTFRNNHARPSPRSHNCPIDHRANC